MNTYVSSFPTMTQSISKKLAGFSCHIFRSTQLFGFTIFSLDDQNRLYFSFKRLPVYFAICRIIFFMLCSYYYRQLQDLFENVTGSRSSTEQFSENILSWSILLTEVACLTSLYFKRHKVIEFWVDLTKCITSVSEGFAEDNGQSILSTIRQHVPHLFCGSLSWAHYYIRGLPLYSFCT